MIGDEGGGLLTGPGPGTGTGRGANRPYIITADQVGEYYLFLVRPGPNGTEIQSDEVFIPCWVLSGDL